MPPKEYRQYLGKLDREDAAHITDVFEVKRRKEAAKGWQAVSDNLSDNAFADDVVDNDNRPYKCRALPEVYGSLHNYD